MIVISEMVVWLERHQLVQLEIWELVVLGCRKVATKVLPEASRLVARFRLGVLVVL
jgi:hypothetical protein